MNNILIITDGQATTNNWRPMAGKVLVSLDENYSSNIHCLVPNRDLPKITGDTLLFIPYSRDNDWNYKQNARGLRCKIGNDNCSIIETDITYPIHKKIGLSYTEEVHILLLAIEFFLSQNNKVEITTKIDLRSDKQNLYLEKLISDSKIKVLYE